MDNRILINCFKLVVLILVMGYVGFLCSDYRESSSLRMNIIKLRGLL